MSDYASLKVPELKKLLQEKSLPVTGNKADLIARLQEHDKSKAAPVRETEDEIDYSDDEDPAAAQPAEPEKPAESAKPAEPAPAPVEENKSTEPSEPMEPLNDTTIDSPTTEDKPAEPVAAEADTSEAPKADFSAHLPASKADDEARKRAERAKRFGLVENDEDNKKVVRAERFGVDQSTLVKGLDAALPEKRPPKRGREGGNVDNDRGAKRQTTGGRQRGKGRWRQGGSGRPGGAARNEGRPNGPRGKAGILGDPSEKAKAEARAKRFGGS
ncbi:hypothetical protein AAE478_004206 [Parahypoxylon ruwenzoriense]